MLERYFAKPQTVDRVRACWIGPEIERYVEWLSERDDAARTVWHRVPILVLFSEFARERGAKAVADLPAHVEAFVAWWAARSTVPVVVASATGWAGKCAVRSNNCCAW